MFVTVTLWLLHQQPCHGEFSTPFFNDNSCTLEVQAADEDLLARQHVYSDCVNVDWNIALSWADGLIWALSGILL